MDFFESFISSNADARLAQLTVQHSAEKSCWVALPPALVSKLYSESASLRAVLELKRSATGRDRSTNAPESWHVSWGGAASKGQHLEIPAALAGCLGIAQGITVSVQVVTDIPEAIGVCVEPLSVDDWEVVEQNAGHMEEQILSQVGVVQAGQAFPFWARQQTKLLLKVTTAHPASLVQLARDSEVAVAPRPRRALAQQNVLRDTDLKSAPASSQQESAGPDTWLRLQGASDETAPFLCSIAGSDEASVSGFQGSTPLTTCVCINRLTAKQAMLTDSDLVLVSRNHPRSSQHVLSIKISNQVARGHAQLPQAVLQSLKLRQHDRLKLQSITSATQIHPRAVTLHPIPYPPAADADLLDSSPSLESPGVGEHLSQQHLKQLLAAWLAAQTGLADSEQKEEEHVPVQQGTVVQLEADHADGFKHMHNMAFQIHMKQGPSFGQAPTTTYALLSATDLAASGNIAVSQGGPVITSHWAMPEKASHQVQQQQAAMLCSSEAMHAAANTALQHVLPMLAFPCRAVLQQMGTPAPGGLLLSGPAGCGKTCLAHLVATILHHHPQTLTHIVTVNCQDVANDSPPNIMKHLIPKIQEGMDCMPSLLILDDLHLICPAPGDSPENPNGNSSAALVEFVCDVLDSFRPLGKPALPVVVLGSCNDVGQVAAPLRAPGYLDHNIALPAPGAQERGSMLASHLSARGAQYDLQHLQAVAAKAEGYDAADLRVLADRALHAAARRHLTPGSGADAQSSGALMISPEDLADAEQGFQPAAAWGVGQLQGGVGGVEGWQDVGGLADVRAALQEALELPTKYAALIARAPLRLRTGVLLYGPPGCGKTHIVAAAVAAAGMRLVSVKGPEVLNKYIGASEAAVRDLFRRAQAAAPCVMFFDEFDAIAPQRGHDSTGVTDRVVNQLLTQLDGVEGLTGVSVLAATSRPDLLDAALLRPGRLDRLIYCGFPNTNERGQILHALARRLRLDATVDLDAVGVQCEGYSGADLSALLSEAQLAAVHERLDLADEHAATHQVCPQHPSSCS
ncbi:MAG: peroxisome biogenesis 1-like [Trebouxia sp. A1-2]|nr:MAG: peroxisome biogenesis 1-like [Trebouxia sp. A1-2]